MKKLNISDLWFYKYRYQITYSGLFLAYLIIILYTLFVAPNGLTVDEINTVKKSANINFSNIFSNEIINLPFKILQNFSILLFGLNNFSIKFPSILISIATIFAIIKLSHRWFTRGTATLSAIIAITSSQFFFLAGNGTAEILYIFYPILILLLGDEFYKTRKNAPLILLILISAISLYTPLSFYIILAIFLTIFAHPHLRFIVLREPKKRKWSIIGIFSVAILPLIFSILFNFSVLKQILGLPENFELMKNIKQVFNTLFGFYSKGTGGVVSPIISPASLILITIGCYFTFSKKHTAKSYLIYFWTIILLFICIINPHAITTLFTPILILTIIGLQSLIQTWYAIFPKNPYARVLGLIPIVFLINSMLLAGLNNFKQNYMYTPEIVNQFNQDLSLLLSNSNNERVLMTSKEELPFFEILARQNKAEIAEDFKKSEIILTKSAFEEKQIPQEYKISKIIVSSRNSNADRFYVLSKI